MIRQLALAAFLSVAVTPAGLAAQGLPFHTETALTTAFEERGLRTFAQYGTRENMSALAIPLVALPYAPHENLTTRVVLPVVHKQLTSTGAGGGELFSSTGVGDLALALKWAFHVRNRLEGTTRVAFVAHASLPTGSTSTSMVDGSAAPRPLQVGSGAFSAGGTLVATMVRGRWGLSADVGHTRHGDGDGYRFGPTTRYDAAIGFRIPRHVETIRTRTIQLYLEWNGTVKGRDRAGGAELADSGGHVAFLSPGIQWVPLPQLLFEASVQVPVLQDLNVDQPEFGVRPAAGLRFLFF